MVGRLTKAVKCIYPKSRHWFKLLICIIPLSFLLHETGSMMNPNSLEKNLGHRKVKRPIEKSHNRYVPAQAGCLCMCAPLDHTKLLFHRHGQSDSW